MKKQIYYSNDGGNTWEGPLEEAEIETLRAVGVVTAETQVRAGGAAPAAAPAADSAPTAGGASSAVPPPVNAGEAMYMLFHNGVQGGPYSRETLAGMLRTGAASEQDKVWTEGMTEWVSIKEVVSVGAMKADELPSLKEFSFGRFFSTAFKHHSVAEAEELFCAGTAHGTPMLAQVNENWPAPWFFMRLIVFSLVLFFGFDFALEHYHNRNLVPGWIFVGAFGFPLCLLVLFFEMNVRKDVSAYRCFYMFLGGGLLSLIFACALFEIVNTSRGAYIAGFVEEPAKLLAVVLVAGVMRNGRILTGLLLGAAVGAGFAAFETAGYIYNKMWLSDNAASFVQGIVTVAQQVHLSDSERQLLAETAVKTHFVSATAAEQVFSTTKARALLTLVGMHTQWTAITAGAYWYVLHLRVKEHLRKPDNKDFGFEVFSDFRFWRLALIPVALHAFWNSNLLMGSEEAQYIKFGICGVLAWFFVFKLVAAGLKQVKQEKIEKGLVAATK